MRLTVAVLALLLALPATAAAAKPSYRPTDTRTYVARLVQTAGIYRKPDAPRPERRLLPWIPRTGNPVVLQVLDRRFGKRDAPWLKVLLPTRPNGSTGWIRQARAVLAVERTRVIISLSKHRLTVLRRGKVIRRVGVALGARSTPTPRGHFAVYQKILEPDYSPLGPWALHLTAHSNVLFEFDGGPGRVAIHGARGKLWASAGTNPSHGCIRVPDPDIALIAPLVSPGTPVDIVP